MNPFNPFVENYRVYRLVSLLGFLFPLTLFVTLLYVMTHNTTNLRVGSYIFVGLFLLGIYLVTWAKQFHNRHILKKKRAVMVDALINGFHAFGDTITLVINSILLSVVYFVGIGIIALFSRIMKKRYLDLKENNKVKSYWDEYHLTTKEKESYYRQF